MALGVGDKIPEFIVKDNRGNDFDSSSVIGKKPTVIYFYPKDDTPGCTTQACSFRDQYEDFKELGAEIIGISSGTAASHTKFIEKYKLPFILLTDSDKKIRKLFGVKSNWFGLLPGRVTYVTDSDGIIRLVFDGKQAKTHIPKALDTIKQIISKKSK